MEDASTNIVATTAKRLPWFDGKDIHACHDWEARVQVHLNTSAPSVCDILTG